MKVKARLLGPLLLTLDGFDITPTASRARTLLAGLLMGGGRTVQADALIEEVWGEGSPLSAPALLQNHIHRLRKHVDAVAGAGRGRELFVSGPAGYGLRLDERDLDSHQFLSLLGRARVAESENKPAEVCELTEAALDLWRGPPLAGSPKGVLTTPYVVRLEEQRLEAFTLRAEAQLRQGQYGLVVAELRGLVYEHPQHSRLRFQLATALQEGGQSVEAREILRALSSAPGTPSDTPGTSAGPLPAGPPAAPSPAPAAASAPQATPPADAAPPEAPSETREAHTPHIHFTVLGPVGIRRGSHPVSPGSPLQRALLAALLLRNGRTATFHELIDAMWGENPPDSARSALHTFVSRLRRDVRQHLPGSPALTSGQGGYALDVTGAGAVLDLDVAHALVAEAEKRERAGDPAGARELYDQALRQWEGEPLANVPGPYAETQRVRLEEWRLQLLEHRLDLDLEAGAHAEAVSELTALTAAHPLRERLRELLMLALYRSGRQAEALAVYADTRRLLADELGVDPGSGLSRLQQRILEADDELHPPPLRVGEGDRPHQLPASTHDFTPRSGLVTSLSDQLTAGEGTVAAVSGFGGVGKTTLAVHVAHAARAHFPDGQLYVDLQGAGPAAAEPGTVLGRFLQALGTSPENVPDVPEDRAALYRSLLWDRRVLVLLDNARDAAQVRPLLPGTPGCAALVTSRARMVDLAGAHLVDL
ncbi:AfsR/SARP family transcriptional regulator, partial [Streptomyces sp. N2-109]